MDQLWLARQTPSPTLHEAIAIDLGRAWARGEITVGRSTELVGRHTIKAERAAAAQDEREAAGRLECQWQRAQIPHEIRELVLDDQRLRNELCWFAFDC